MKRKILAVLLAALMVLTLAACKEDKSEATTTLTGMVVSVDGSTITLMEMDMASRGGADFAGGERPEGMEGFSGSFDPENMPEGFSGSFDPNNMPEGFTIPQDGSGERPTMPEGMTIPENGEMPSFEGRGEQGEFNIEDFASDAETKTLDIGSAHISVEIDGGKASGSLEDIQAGSMVTVTLDGSGKVTNVLVSSSGMGGFGSMGGFGGFGDMENFDPSQIPTA